jgi:DNA-binding transcriptional LysR family regulator
MPRLLCDDMIALRQAALAGLGIVALPGYVCRDDVRSGVLRRVPPTWFAGDSMITAPIHYRRGSPPLGSRFCGSLGGRIATNGPGLI